MWGGVNNSNISQKEAKQEKQNVVMFFYCKMQISFLKVLYFVFIIEISNQLQPSINMRRGKGIPDDLKIWKENNLDMLFHNSSYSKVLPFAIYGNIQ